MSRGLTLALLFFIEAAFISAHPHVFIDIGIEFDSMESAEIMWTFDKIESSNKIYYFDDDENGILDEKESKNLYNEGFKSVKDFNYFITLTTDKGQFPLEKISNFSTYINDDGRLTVSFLIDLPKSDNSTLSISHLDTSYFIAFSEPEESDVKIPEGLFSKAFKNKEHPIYYDPNAERTVILDTSEPKPGWLTAYPTQVIISTNPIIGYDDEVTTTFQERIVNLQRGIYQKLSSELVDYQNILYILLLSLAYGVIHALGPGHRKILISSYILSREKTSYIKAVSLSMLSALIHSGSGILIILLLNLIFKSVEQHFVDSINNFMELISYVSILIISVTLIIIKLVKLFRKKSKKVENKTVGISLIIFSSIVPCPGALTIMLFSLTVNMISTGILTVFAMSLGIGITLSIISLLTLKGKNSINKFSSKFTYVGVIIEWLGLISLLLYSLLMVSI